MGQCLGNHVRVPRELARKPIKNAYVNTLAPSEASTLIPYENKVTQMTLEEKSKQKHINY